MFWKALTTLTAVLAALLPGVASGSTCVGTRAQLDRCYAGLSPRRRLGEAGWQTGEATYYMSYEGGPVGAGGKRLEAFKSVAVPLSQFKKREGAWVEVRGIGTFRVDDACAGGGCKDLDIFVGDSEENARRLPDWEEGNMPIQYRWAA